MILVALLYAILAATFIIAKTTLLYAPPFFLIAFRMIFAGLLLLSYYRVVYGPIVIKTQDYWLFAQTAWYHIFCAFVLEFWALQYLTALKTTVIYSITPFVTAIFSYLLLNQLLNTQKIIGILLGLIGLIPICLVHAQAEVNLLVWQVSLADIVLLIAVISSAYAWFLVKKLMERGYSLLVINGIVMFFGGILSEIASLCLEGIIPQVSNWGLFFQWIALLILVANVVVYNFYGYLMQRYSLTFISLSGFLCPVFAALYEWLFLQGTISWHYVVSLALVTIGLFLFYRTELKFVSLGN